MSNSAGQPPPTEPRPGPAHETRIRVLEVGHHTLTGQVAELTVAIRNLERRVPELMAIGIREGLGDPATWAAARRAMGVQFEHAAGSWLIGGAKVLANRALWICAGLVALYYVGGLPAVLSFFKARLAP